MLSGYVLVASLCLNHFREVKMPSSFRKSRIQAISHAALQPSLAASFEEALILNLNEHDVPDSGIFI